jgi:hypothetical protein
MEAGLSLQHVFGILRIDAGYRLTHADGGRNYFFGISIAP